MIEHDRQVGILLNLLDELGIAEDTIVLYSTDNGPHMNTWPDAAMTPFRNEKNSCWEGAFRVPEVMRWPGKIPAGTISNEMVSHLDWLPTFLAAAGEPDIKEKLKEGYKAGDRTSGCILTATICFHTLQEKKKNPRVPNFYFSADGDLVALRYDNWKMVFRSSA